MKIVQFTIRFLPSEGGTERATYYLCRELALNGHQVSIVTANANNFSKDKVISNYKILKYQTANYLSTETIDDITVYRYPYLISNNSPPIFSPSLVTFNVSNFDIIHLQGVNMTSSFSILSLLVTLKGRRFVATTHGIAEFSVRSNFEKLFVTRLYLKRAEKIIALCQYESNMLLQLGISPEKIVIIPNGVDLNRFKCKPSVERITELKKKYRLAKYVMICVGRVASNKGFESLIEAAIAFRNDDVSFVIVGPSVDAVYLRKLKSLIDYYGLNKKFVLTGWVPDTEIVDLLFLSDIFVFPSIIDTFGLVNLDAMAAGKPVVASSTGGVSEIVQHGKTGIIVTPGDSLELSKAIRKLLDDKELRDFMGLNGQRVVKEKFSWEKICSETITVYQNIC
jgi:glycosyltransferase involved in cell wall biosynthesis